MLKVARRWWQYSESFRNRFGLIAGMKAANSMADADYRLPAGTHVDISIPEWKFPLTLRAQTSDGAVFRQVVVERELELTFAPSPARIIDAGANIGISVRVFAERWPDAQIIAVELESENADLLRKNVSSYPQVTARQGALWGGKGGVRLQDPNADEYMYAATESLGVGGPTIPSFGVEDLLDEAGWDTIDLLKLDIEGGEIAVFNASSRWIRRCRRIAVELHDRYAPGCTAAMERAINPSEWNVTVRGEYLIAERKVWPCQP